MFIEDPRLTAPVNKIINEAGGYHIHREQSQNYYTLYFGDFC